MSSVDDYLTKNRPASKRSLLFDFANEIFDLQAKGASLAQISDYLFLRHQITVSKTGVHLWLKRQKRIPIPNQRDISVNENPASDAVSPSNITRPDLVAAAPGVAVEVDAAEKDVIEKGGVDAKWGPTARAGIKSDLDKKYAKVLAGNKLQGGLQTLFSKDEN